MVVVVGSGDVRRLFVALKAGEELKHPSSHKKGHSRHLTLQQKLNFMPLRADESIETHPIYSTTLLLVTNTKLLTYAPTPN